MCQQRLAVTDQDILFTDPSVLTEIYDPSRNIVVWDRELPPAICSYSDHLVARSKRFQVRLLGSLTGILRELDAALPSGIGKNEFTSDVELLVNMFCELFALEEIGFRLAVLDKAMCPKFHVDRVPCRLATTYRGPGTEWLDNHCALRDENGRVQVSASAYINTLAKGAVALLKGDAWEGNEGRGLVHRSPAVNSFAQRLFLTLDFL